MSNIDKTHETDAATPSGTPQPGATDETVEPTEENQLHYLGATTRHEGTGESKQPLPQVDASEITGDLQPGVTGDAEPKHRKQR